MALAGDHEPADDDDPRLPRRPTLDDILPPVRWPLSMAAGLCCGAGAAWSWSASGPSRLALVATAAASAWLAFAALGFRRWRRRSSL